MNQPVMRADRMSRADIENASLKVLKDFCPDAAERLLPLDIERLFEQYLPKRFGVATRYSDLSFGIHGMTDPEKMLSIVSVSLVEADDAGTRRFGRSTIGHEIGHAVLHAQQFKRKRLEAKFYNDEDHSGQQLFRQSDLRPFENPEWQAWEFCKSLFLPKHLISDAFNNGESVQQIAEKVDLNPKFIEVRLKNLKLA